MLLQVEKLVSGGLGLCRSAQGIVFVQGALPGEVIEARIVGKTGGVPLATLQRIEQPAPGRVTPPCPYAGRCGGCDWLHIDPVEQVRFKESIVVDCLRRIARLTQIPPVEHFSSPDRGYRLRAQFKVDPKTRAPGFFAVSSTRVVAIERCPVLVDRLNDFLAQFVRIDVRLPDTIHQLPVFCGDTAVASAPPLANLTVPQVSRRVGTLLFELEANNFFQSNRFLLDAMATWAADRLGGDTLIDMFGGMGFFGLQRAPQFGKVAIVESDSGLVARARRTCQLNGIVNAEVLAMEAQRFFAASGAAWRQADCLIVDPPRTGLPDAVRQGIASMRPRSILSISCDPATQARDLRALMTRAGYRLDRLALFDCYPHTHHIETGALLTL